VPALQAPANDRRQQKTQQGRQRQRGSTPRARKYKHGKPDARRDHDHRTANGSIRPADPAPPPTSSRSYRVQLLANLEMTSGMLTVFF